MKTTPSIIQFPSPAPVMKPPFKKAAILIGTLAIAGSMVSCNTVAGLGRDTQKVGNKIEEKAHEVAR
ncbi:MAG: entericidin A/B family lipoprotein [Verrucomicrobium sp.]